MKHSPFFPPLDGAAPCGSGALAAKFGRVTKKLAPGADGAKQWTERFGAKLVCVRYREDAAGGKQYKTVELVVGERRLQTRRRDEAAIPVRVRIAYNETELHAKAKQAGALWDAKARLWTMSTATAQALGLHERIVPQK